MTTSFLNRFGALIIVLLGASFVAAEERADVANRLQADVKTLAADEFEGRGVGTEGLEKAAEYVRAAFAEAGLSEAVPDGDVFQEFQITTGAELGEGNRLSFQAADGTVLELAFDADFRTCSFASSGKFSKPIVFAGYGIESEDPAYNDFADVDVTDKVVIIMRRNPQQGREDGMFAVAHGASRHAGLSTKVSQAFQHGAAAVLFVNDPFTAASAAATLADEREKAQQQVFEAAKALAESAEGDDRDAATTKLEEAVRHAQEVREQFETLDRDPLIEFGYGGTRGGRSLPIMHITKQVCDKLLATAGTSLAELEQQIDETGEPRSFELEGWTAGGQASVNPIRVEIRNVIGVIEGDGPHADQTVVVGAHYDHVGFGGEGSLAPGSHDVHNGADDNASGTAAILELARRLAARKEPLPRRVVFIAFTGEERGLLGSAHYVKEPIFPLDQTIAMINLDMVGRLVDDELIVYGTGTSSVWDDWVDRAAAASRLDISKKPEGFGPSDHSSFYGKQIPVLHLFTGTHSDYHRPGDDWDKVNYDGMARIVDFTEELVVDVANVGERPDYIEIQGRASVQRSGNRPYFGSIPDFSSDDVGYAIQGVAPESPAAKAGLKGGDVIIRFGGQQIGGLDDFDLALRKFEAGQEVEVVVRRKGEEVTLKVTLAQPRG